MTKYLESLLINILRNIRYNQFYKIIFYFIIRRSYNEDVLNNKKYIKNAFMGK